ncbi:dihydroorotate dehydrogenase electron transfer subunit [Syntrophomonas erecta]
MPGIENGLVIRHNQISDDMYEIEFISPKIAPLCQPGQFIHVKPGVYNQPLLRRPLSLCDVDKKLGSITLLYKRVGEGTDMLTRVRTKDYLDVMGPLGQGFSLPGSGKNVVLVGGGVGIAPLVYLARVLKEQHCQVKVFHGMENRRQLAAFEKFRAIGIDFLPATMDGSAGFKGLVTDLLWKKINPTEIDYVYTCGPEPMMAAVADYCREYGLPGEVSLEEYMACGVGACLGCARKLKPEDEYYVKVCHDGPVFNMQDVCLYKK